MQKLSLSSKEKKNVDDSPNSFRQTEIAAVGHVKRRRYVGAFQASFPFPALGSTTGSELVHTGVKYNV